MTIFRSFAAPCGLFLFVAACGSVTSPGVDAGDDDVTVDAGPPDAAPTLALALGRDALTVPLDIEAEIAVTVTRGGFDGDVVIDAATLGGVTVEPLTLPAGTDTGTLVIAIQDGIVAGTATLVVTAHAPGEAALGDDSVTLTFAPGDPAFDLSWVSEGITERSLWTVPGWTVPAAVNVTTRGGYAAEVTGTWTGLPTGSTSVPATFATGIDDNVFGDVPFTTGDAAAPGGVTATLVVSDGTLRQTIHANIRVGPAPGLDPAIGTAGRIAIDASGWASDVRPREVEIDSVGRLLIIADATDRGMVMRLTAAGALDATYGLSGITGVTSGGLTIADGDVDAADNAVIVGSRNGTLCALRFFATGTWDSTTFAGCTTTVPFVPTAMRIRPNGKIVIAGSSTGATLIRLNADGGLDGTFTSAVIATNAYIEDLAVDSNGRFVVVGNWGGVPMVARFTSSGALDTTFGVSGGVATFTPPGSDAAASASAVTIGDDGDIVIAGSLSVAGVSHGFVAKLDPDGNQMDASFGTDGMVVLAGSTDWLDELHLTQIRESAGLGITVYGERFENGGTRPHMIRARLDATGALVTSFGAGGYDWLLGGGDYEQLGGARFTSTGAWLVGRTGTGTVTVLKEASL
jgi:uncharacterized delta-60 repeat protein